MRINLQKLAFSTLTFSLATTLAITAFSESASAKKKGAKYNKSNVVPSLVFEAFFETDNGDDILDTEDNNENIGIFPNAIQLEQANINPKSFVGEPGEELFDLRDKAELFEEDNVFSGFLDQENRVFNLSATRLEDDLIQYQIYQGYIDNPDLGIRFAPVEAPSSNLDFVNNIENIIESSDIGEYTIEETNEKFTQNGAGVLGLAINKSIRFLDEGDNDINDALDDLKITQIGSRPSPSTSIPEPTTTLASIFALGFAGKFLRKSKKDNA